MRDLQAWCKRLDYLFRRGQPCPQNRARIEQLLATIDMSPVLNDIELLRDRKDLTKLYFKFCELTLMGEDTGEIVQDLRRSVHDQIRLANRQIDEFNSVYTEYREGGRQELALLMQKNAEAGEYATFFVSLCLC
jgi:hypothetical protein